MFRRATPTAIHRKCGIRALRALPSMTFAVSFSAVIACGGGAPTTSATSTTPEASATSSATPADAGPPAEAQCRVTSSEGGTDGRTVVYLFEHGLLREAVATDPASGRAFTTRYSWDEQRRLLRVEKIPPDREPGPAVTMRYEGARDHGRVVGQEEAEGTIVERITWFFDPGGRPIKRNHEWFPTPTELRDGQQPRSEGDVCRYDELGRPTAFELSLEGERLLDVTYQYTGNSPWPSQVREVHPVGESEPEDHRATVELLEEDPPNVLVTWPEIDGQAQTTRYEGTCTDVFFPTVCSPALAPPGTSNDGD